MKGEVSIESLRRIRNYDKICGYRRTESRVHYYSKDLFWWNGTPITGMQMDQCCGYKDIDDRPIFEGDIIECSFKGLMNRTRHFVVYQAEGCWYGKNWKTGKSDPLDLLFLKSKPRFVSYAFLQT